MMIEVSEEYISKYDLSPLTKDALEELYTRYNGDFSSFESALSNYDNYMPHIGITHLVTIEDSQDKSRIQGHLIECLYDEKEKVIFIYLSENLGKNASKEDYVVESKAYLMYSDNMEYSKIIKSTSYGKLNVVLM